LQSKDLLVATQLNNLAFNYGTNLGGDHSFY